MEIFDTSLSLSSRYIIMGWLIDEFETIYFAKKCLPELEDIKLFILDMIEQSKNDAIIPEINPRRYNSYKNPERIH